MEESQPYNGLLGLDRLPTWVKAVIWIIIFFGTTFEFTAEIAYGSTGLGICPSPLSSSTYSIPSYEEITIYEIMIYMIAPAVGTLCLAGVVLRLLGISWRYIFVLWAMVSVLSSFLLLAYMDSCWFRIT